MRTERLVSRARIPELVLVSPVETERLLPGTAEGEVEVYAGNDGFEAYGYEAAGYCWAQLPGMAVFRFDARDSDVTAIPDDGASDAVIEDAYYRSVLPLVLQLRGYEVLHASAVSSEQGLLIMCGVSGAGKSTLAYGLSQRGYANWADDAVVLDLDDESIAALPVPFRLSLRGEAATPSGAWMPVRGVSESGVGRTRVRVLAVLERAGARDAPLVEITRLPAASAFTTLLPHAYFFQFSNRSRNAALVCRYLRLASSTPTLRIRYRPGLDRIDAVLDQVERHALGGEL